MDEKDHRLLQKKFIKAYPFLRAEVPFTDICRIADLVWEEKKIILEIQFSPIAPHEAEERARDYAMKGYELIWLLDDRTFKKSSFLDGYLFSFKEKLFYKKPAPMPRKERRILFFMRRIFYTTLEILLRSIAKK